LRLAGRPGCPSGHGAASSFETTLLRTATGVALIPVALEEVRRRHDGAHRLRYRHHVEPVAVAGQVHHLKLGGGERCHISLALGEIHRVHQLQRLQQRADIDIEIERVNRDAARRDAELLMRAPFVGHGFAECDHLLDDGRLALQRGLLRPRGLVGLVAQRLEDDAPMFGQKVDSVGGEQLVVAKCGGNRAAAGAFQPGLHIVFAIAAGFEAVDADRLILCQAKARRNLGIGALVFDFGRGLARRELEVLLRIGEEIRNHRKRLAWCRRRRRRRRIDRLWRAAVNRRLGQHVIFGNDGLAVAPLGVARPPLVADRAPIGGGFFIELLADGGVFRVLAAILRDLLRRLGEDDGRQH